MSGNERSAERGHLMVGLVAAVAVMMILTLVAEQLWKDVLRRDLEANFKGVLQGQLAKLDLVTREEFDVQANVLKRTRSKLAALEKRLADLEGK